MLKRRLLFLFLLLFFFSMTAFLRAQEKKEPLFPFTQYQLNNGLNVILSEDYSLPLVSIVVAYRVGSINEQQGRTGLAFLLENLMFQGSRNISRMQHYSYIQKIGGVLNTTTNWDRTVFYQTVPSNQLALVLWLESDRMRSLTINESNVARTKDSIIEEIHLRRTSDPYRESSLYFEQLLFPDFAYHHPIIGEEADLRKLTADDVKGFHSTYYIPNNAVLCIVGNIDLRKTENLIKRYFETIPSGENPPPLPSPSNPIETKGSTSTYENTLASSPGFLLGYRIASPYTNDFYPLTIIDYILLKGKSSRLYKRLIRRDRIAFHLSGGIDKKKDLANLKIFVLSSNEAIKQRSLRVVTSEINKLRSSLISEKELNRAKSMFRMNYINQYSSAVDKAIFLIEAFCSGISLDQLAGELDKYLKVTPSSIIGIANRYFKQDGIILDIKIK